MAINPVLREAQACRQLPKMESATVALAENVAAAQPKAFEPGQWVRLQNMHVDLNGKWGQLMHWDAARMRWQLRVKASAGGLIDAVVQNFQKEKSDVEHPEPTVVDTWTCRGSRAERDLKAFQRFCGLTPDCPACTLGAKSRWHSAT